MKMDKLGPHNFTASRWRAWNIPQEMPSLGWRTVNIIAFRRTIKKYAIGYVEGERLHVRPKKNQYGVMFCYDGELSWCHLTEMEFKEVFK